ncbi:septation protein SepH [Isoptericola variabilis]|uniref:DUF3071 domain-containing protein n=1 Tax=Isoptericola variabilis (strain 225) TaxID=743718 RepID=F6FWG1_ISOV2|nr:septation protein SepH [Isoptericola variabilis]AEG44535.1 hypothetical protein Isova_1788 [Isoptericola variabilis 225]TWH26549.1 Protein of unknown function (DUF3071) [Isoptericola variabilis J7]
MAELELVRLHEDGERLVLRASDGTEHALPITEALRAAVRRDRPRTEALQAQAHAPLRPRDLQARLRAGATAEELAAESGLPVEHVRRYEWPVVAEREHAVGQVRAHRIDGDSDRTLGEAADARLAARGVSTDEATWSARRDGTAPWVVEVRFSAGERDRSARWTFDPRGRVVTPLDDEARWLGQPDDPLSPEMVGVPSITSRSHARGDSARRPADAAADATALLLDDLAGRRGQRPGSRTARRADDPYQSEELPLGDLDPAPRPATGAVPRVRRPGEGAAPETGHQPVARIPAPWVHDAGPQEGPPGATSAGAPQGTASGTVPGAVPDGEPEGASVVDLGARRQRAVAPAGDPAPEREPSGDTAPEPSSGSPSGPAPAEPAPAGERPDHGRPRPSPGPAHPAAPAPASREPEPASDARRGPAGRRPGRKGRAQVPSWDEIVFGGARPQK